MYINLNKQFVLYDDDGKLKSIDYLKLKLKHGFNSPNEIICMPLISVCGAFFAFILAKQIAE